MSRPIAHARRLVLLALVAALALATAAVPASAQAPVQDRINAAFRKWLSDNKVSNAGLAVMRDNELVGSYGSNAMSAETPAPVASLSKAVTAVCVMSLIDNGRLRFDTRLSALGPRFRRATGPWSSAAVGDITIEQLLRHRSRITHDPSQKGLGDVPNSASADLVLIRRALAQPLLTMPSADIYNNINYAILGYVIRTVTGEPYESYCRRTALAPRGAGQARIGAGTRAMGAFGGWEISAVDYARFARAFDPRSRLLSPAAHRFIDAKANPRTPTAALGVFVVATPQGRNLFHHGSWRSTATTPQRFGAFFAMWNNGISVVATYDENVTDAARNALDNALRQAAYSRG
ncbi:serine hydrolase domain-containing protein [Nonomuraea aridisoli]|uniref:Beta-lactamase-related domain-containing protein n=1 Tax=Nonomuraea aridisoli TaxID=2070368 RepID=A0A2W2EE12_9ACTN|nr:serine hydrolase domain-containing protein [Nonomuraea aridisoli]PZG10258.1 hypothetical protein C1J01_36415 [Nonomuraea aridisoli]